LPRVQPLSIGNEDPLVLESNVFENSQGPYSNSLERELVELPL
jgi:hypothetical protein